MLAGCIIAIKMSSARTLKNTFGWARIEVLGLLISLLTLGALCFSVLVEAIQTMVHFSHIDAMHHPLLVLGIAAAGLVLNIVSCLFIGDFMNTQARSVSVWSDTVEVSITVPQEVAFGKSQNLWPGSRRKCADGELGKENTCKSTTMDFVRHLSCSIIAMICACLVYFIGGTVALFADPILAIVSVFLLAASTYPMVTESGLILLQTVPSYIDVKTLKKNLLETFPAIMNVHDFHVWRLTRSNSIATTHVTFTSPNAYAVIATQIDDFFHKQGIMLTTIQPEFLKCSESLINEADCVLRCTKNECVKRMCCSNLTAENNAKNDNHIEEDGHFCHSHHHIDTLADGTLQKPDGNLENNQDTVIIDQTSNLEQQKEQSTSSLNTESESKEQMVSVV